MVVSARVVAQQHGRLAVAADEHVHAAIVVEIADGQSTRRERLRKHRPGLLTDVAQAAAVVPEEEERFLVLHVRCAQRDRVIRMAVGEQKIDVAVVVEIEEFQTPAAEQPCRLGQAVLPCDVGEDAALLVPVE